MRIYLMRHGKAEDFAAGGDSQRRLTAEGRQKVVLVALALAKMGIAFDAVFSSPLLRAWETATLVADNLHPRVQPEEALVLARGGSVRELLAPLRTRTDSQHALFVGHMPTMGEWLGELKNAGRPMAEAMSKAAVACFDLPSINRANEAKLQWHHTARELRETL